MFYILVLLKLKNILNFCIKKLVRRKKCTFILFDFQFNQNVMFYLFILSHHEVLKIFLMLWLSWTLHYHETAMF